MGNATLQLLAAKPCNFSEQFFPEAGSGCSGLSQQCWVVGCPGLRGNKGEAGSGEESCCKKGFGYMILRIPIFFGGVGYYVRQNPISDLQFSSSTAICIRTPKKTKREQSLFFLF